MLSSSVAPNFPTHPNFFPTTHSCSLRWLANHPIEYIPFKLLHLVSFYFIFDIRPHRTNPSTRHSFPLNTSFLQTLNTFVRTRKLVHSQQLMYSVSHILLLLWPSFQLSWRQVSSRFPLSLSEQHRRPFVGACPQSSPIHSWKPQMIKNFIVFVNKGWTSLAQNFSVNARKHTVVGFHYKNITPHIPLEVFSHFWTYLTIDWKSRF